MLNKDSISLLKSITNITNSALITYPITTITSERKDILGNIDFSKVEGTGWDEFGIYDLNSFLGALAILDNPDIKQSETSLIAKDSDSSISFVVSHPSSLEEFTTDPENITTTCETPSVVSIDIDTTMITKIRKGVSVFKDLKDLFLVKEGDRLYFKTGNKESFSRTQNSYEVDLTPTINSGNDFEIAILVENFLALPAMDFMLNVKYNKEYDMYRITLENTIYQFLLPTIE